MTRREPMFGRVVRRLLKRHGGFTSSARGTAYWEERVAALGRRSVVNTRYSSKELDEVTQRQRDLLLPLLKAELQGWEKTVLDLGCGAGRFTRDLAATVGGTAIGIDPIARLLDLAPSGPDVSYRLLGACREIPTLQAFDVVQSAA